MTSDHQIIHGDCLDAIREIPDGSVNMILTDPPYFKVKTDAWDRRWDRPEQFISWLSLVADEWRRVLAHNGSIYCFASPQMAHRVGPMLRDRFSVLNEIRWNKSKLPAGRHRAANKEGLRAYFPAQETIFFCEQQGSDRAAKGEAGYAAKCSELHAFVFEPLRKYLDDERVRSGLSVSQMNEAVGSVAMASHYFSRSQWALPTRSKYESLRRYSVTHGQCKDPFQREYEDLRREYEDLRREYEDLRREYEDLRRPFFAKADRPFTDTWEFQTVQPYPGKHPCEKPIPLLRHAIEMSTRRGDLVLDTFAGTGSTGVACKELGRRFIGCELSVEYAQEASRRLARAEVPKSSPQSELFEVAS